MVKNYTKLSVDITTKKLVMTDCKKQFLKKHPEMLGLNITEDFMIKQLALDYLEVEYEHY